MSSTPSLRLEGYAAKFNELSIDLGGHVEYIAPGAFAESLRRGDDVRALFNHDPNLVLGRRSAGTLHVVEDDIGLRFSIEVTENSVTTPLLDAVLRGDVTGCSFTCVVLTDEWTTRRGQSIRILHEVRLWDVGPVTFPAYPQTRVDVALRSKRLHSSLDHLRRKIELAAAA